MDKDYYLLKEIFLGLRSEYRFYQIDLDGLKNYSEINREDKVVDYYFKIIDDNPKLYCYINMKKNILKQLIDYIEIKLDKYNNKDNYETYHCCDEMIFTNGKTFIKGGKDLKKKLIQF